MLILRQSTYVVKSHSLYNDKSFFDFSTLQLVLIRNPVGYPFRLTKRRLLRIFQFLAIVSNYNLKQSGNNKGKAEPRHFHSEPWRKYVNVSTSLWKKKYLHWLQWYQNQTIIVVYEHLRDSLQFELLKLAKFLRLSVNPVRLKCLLDHPFGKYKRVKPNVEAIFPFTLHETKVIARYGTSNRYTTKLRDEGTVLGPRHKRLIK